MISVKDQRLNGRRSSFSFTALFSTNGCHFEHLHFVCLLFLCISQLQNMKSIWMKMKEVLCPCSSFPLDHLLKWWNKRWELNNILGDYWKIETNIKKGYSLWTARHTGVAHGLQSIIDSYLYVSNTKPFGEMKIHNSHINIKKIHLKFQRHISISSEVKIANHYDMSIHAKNWEICSVLMLQLDFSHFWNISGPDSVWARILLMIFLFPYSEYSCPSQKLFMDLWAFDWKISIFMRTIETLGV